jgi:hypothetical protein
MIIHYHFSFRWFKKNRMGSSGKDTDFNSELEWIQFRQDALGEYAFQEGPQDKLSRKIKENPFVPIGKCVCSTLCIWYKKHVI